MDNISAPQNPGVCGRIVPKKRTARSFIFSTVSFYNEFVDFNEVNLQFFGNAIS
jgi:hypothetical protein